jgi:hypothetical protein
MKKVSVFILIICASWGFLAHKTLQQISIYQLPDDLAGYFYANQDYLVQQSIRPDVRRKDDKQEDAKHYLDMDAPLFGADYKTSIPHDFNQAVLKYSMDSLRKEGLVPWEVVRVYGRLVEAFKSTLEEVSESDLIVHVVDGAHPDPMEQLRAVRQVIGEIGGGEILEIIAINKADVAAPEVLMELLRKESNAYAISARTGYGIDTLIKAIESSLPKPKVEINAVIPFNRGDLVSAVHEQGEIISEEYLPEGTKLHAMVGGALARKIELL